ncbi:hypothetical protein U2P60_04065 [Brucella sp. H1_1004]|uniref:hypothetical protein n=1 Tax=Brucella sp. H1_1004 TaxID=3110109 RepID=UPI0039B412B1
MKAALTLPALALLAGCVSINAVEPGPQGYDAIEFTRATLVQDHAWNKYLFPAGRRFIADRRASDGRKLYCGLLTINGDQRPFDTCIGFEAPNTLILAPGVPLKEVRRPQPAGTVKQIKFQP